MFLFTSMMCSYLNHFIHNQNVFRNVRKYMTLGKVSGFCYFLSVVFCHKNIVILYTIKSSLKLCLYCLYGKECWNNSLVFQPLWAASILIKTHIQIVDDNFTHDWSHIVRIDDARHTSPQKWVHKKCMHKKCVYENICAKMCTQKSVHNNVHTKISAQKCTHKNVW